MPRLACWFMRSAMLYMVLGFTLGGLLLFQKAIPVDPLVWRLLPAHTEIVLLAWMVQAAMGMAYWILPRIAGRPGNERLAWLCFGLLNAGVWMSSVGKVLGMPEMVPLIGRLAELASVAAFALHALPRLQVPDVSK